MEDKYLIFALGSMVLVPMGILVARNHSRVLNIVFIALVFGTTQTESLFGLPTDINFLSREWYRGSTRGIEVSYIDLLALILLFSSLSFRARDGFRLGRPPSYKFLRAYFLWAAFSVLVVSEPKIFGVFELTKIGRAILVFMAVWAFMRSRDQVILFVYVLVLIAFYEAGVALFDRYILGIHRVSASLPHPNSLSMYCLQLFPVMLSVSFAPDISPRLRKLCYFGSAMAAGTVVLTISRTGFASLAILAFLSVILNIRGRWTARNLGIMAMVFVAGLAVTVKAWDTLSSRYVHFDFKNEYLTDEGDRGTYFRKGWPALEEHPLFGVGLNNWSYWISNRYAKVAGYYSEPYPSLDTAPYSVDQEAPAHNLYLLTVVELGLPGLLLLLALFSRWLCISGVAIRKGDGGLLDRVRIGAFLSLCGVLMQSFTEWEFRQTSLYFMGHITMAVAAFTYYPRMEVSKN